MSNDSGKVSSISAYRKILRLMGRGRDEYGSVPEHLRDRLETKDEHLIDRGAYLFEELVKSTHGKNNSFRIFSLKEIQKATNNFSADLILSNWTWDDFPTYRGIIEDTHVAVKIVKWFLIREVVSLSLIKHRNVVKLLGCCLETYFIIVVHELPPNGTLEENISKLSWTDRLRIATEIADVVAYLHLELNMTHGRLRDTEAVLLDEFHSAKLGLFDNSRIQNQAESSEVGMDNGNKFRKLEDVYDFGSILLNILCIQKGDKSKFTKCKEKAEILKYLKLNVSAEKEMPQIEEYIDLLLICRKVFDHVSMELIIEEDKVDKPVPSMEEVARELRRIRSI